MSNNLKIIIITKRERDHLLTLLKNNEDGKVFADPQVNSKLIKLLNSY